jgi:ABC-2 type transport system ATP-binding protein
MDDANAPAISVAGLGKTYPGGVEAVRGISFDVARGEVFGLLGPNGAGKSTTVGMLTTAIRPTAGTAHVVGIDVAADPLAARLVSSVVFQETVLDRSLTGRQNLELHARLWRVAGAAERIAELAATLGLADLLDRPPSTYSGGERRRLEIARALVSGPELLFLDEPTVGLDPRIRAELLDVVASLRDRAETTILLTTHYLDEAERLCDRVAIVHEGRIVALGSPSALREALGAEIVELRLERGAAAALESLRASGIANEDAFSVGATVTLPLHGRSSTETVAAISASGLRPVAVTTRQPSLDDVYLRLTGKEMQ